MNRPSAQTCDRIAAGPPVIVDLALIAGLWCVTAVIVNPLGEFSIIDDGVYESIVKHLIDTGEYRLTEVSTFPSLTTTLWGALFCLPLGVSFTALRISTLSAALVGLVGTYTLVRDIRPRGSTALLIALLLAFNPAYYTLSHSFMTDVPFTATMIWASVFLTRSLKRHSSFDLLGGTFLTLAATLTRQIGLAVPLAFAGTSLLYNKPGLRAVTRALLPSCACIAGLWVFNNWLAINGRVPPMYTFWTNRLFNELSNPRHLITEPLSNAYVDFLYLGLFLLPIQLLARPFPCWATSAARMRRSWILFAAGITVIASGAVLRLLRGDGLLLPVNGHVLVRSGIGLLWMRGAEHVPSLPEPFWLVLTAGGIVGAILLIGMLGSLCERAARSLLRRTPIVDSEVEMVFLTICAGLYLFPFIAVASSDRYVMPCIPFLAVVTTLFTTPSESGERVNVKHAPPVSLIFIAAFGIFSVAGTRDYLQWKRLGWQAARELMRRDHIGAEDIDGGAEFNGLYRVRPASVSKAFQTFVEENNLASVIATWGPEPLRQLAIETTFAWRPASVPYLIAFGTVPGYTVVKEYSYHNWIPPRVQSVIVLRKT